MNWPTACHVLAAWLLINHTHIEEYLASKIKKTRPAAKQKYVLKRFQNSSMASNSVTFFQNCRKDHFKALTLLQIQSGMCYSGWPDESFPNFRDQEIGEFYVVQDCLSYDGFWSSKMGKGSSGCSKNKPTRCLVTLGHPQADVEKKWEEKLTHAYAVPQKKNLRFRIPNQNFFCQRKKRESLRNIFGRTLFDWSFYSVENLMHQFFFFFLIFFFFSSSRPTKYVIERNYLFEEQHDRIFVNFRASKYVDCCFWTTWNSSIHGYRGPKIVKCSVWKLASFWTSTFSIPSFFSKRKRGSAVGGPLVPRS